jgi:hypothetical protein
MRLLNLFENGFWIIPLVMMVLCFFGFKNKIFGRGCRRNSRENINKYKEEN